jgi:biopolymer transport protein ExbD
MDRRRGVSERKKIQKSEEPQIPITPMLDMAFQLLTFFVLTYRPAPSEGQIIMNLLPAQPSTAITAPAPSEKPSEALPATLRTLPTVLKAGAGGRLEQILVGDTPLATDTKALETELDKYFSDPDLPFEQTMLKVDPRLRYSELMRVMNAFMNAFSHAKKPPSISFDELVPGEGE